MLAIKQSSSALRVATLEKKEKVKKEVPSLSGRGCDGKQKIAFTRGVIFKLVKYPNPYRVTRD